ncbi:hypothetical protein PR048_033412 [Dryococelus australis]|uniref:Uncharacterized protein n=1 Tax=Dryococelus australis TaxID=614101 RepID=A0ABQ9G4D7_9NEOP|nr:hypothetical protein PR048_033412 [Dryococelus australis]
MIEIVRVSSNMRVGVIVPASVTGNYSDRYLQKTGNRTLAQSSPYTMTADNQCAVDIGIFVRKTVESSLQVIDLYGEAWILAAILRSWLQPAPELRMRCRGEKLRINDRVLHRQQNSHAKHKLSTRAIARRRAPGNSAPVNERSTTVCPNHVQFTQKGSDLTSRQQPMEERRRLEYTQCCEFLLDAKKLRGFCRSLLMTKWPQFPLVHTEFDSPWGTLAQSSLSTVTADNQYAVDIGMYVHKTVESSQRVIELSNFSDSLVIPVVSGVVWTNGTMVRSNTDTNRTGVLALVYAEVIPGGHLGIADLCLPRTIVVQLRMSAILVASTSLVAAVGHQDVANDRISYNTKETCGHMSAGMSPHSYSPLSLSCPHDATAWPHTYTHFLTCSPSLHLDQRPSTRPRTLSLSLVLPSPPVYITPDHISSSTRNHPASDSLYTDLPNTRVTAYLLPESVGVTVNSRGPRAYLTVVVVFIGDVTSLEAETTVSGPVFSCMIYSDQVLHPHHLPLVIVFTEHIQSTVGTTAHEERLARQTYSISGLHSLTNPFAITDSRRPGVGSQRVTGQVVASARGCMFRGDVSRWRGRTRDREREHDDEWMFVCRGAEEWCMRGSVCVCVARRWHQGDRRQIEWGRHADPHMSAHPFSSSGVMNSKLRKPQETPCRSAQGQQLLPSPEHTAMSLKLLIPMPSIVNFSPLRQDGVEWLDMVGFSPEFPAPHPHPQFPPPLLARVTCPGVFHASSLTVNFLPVRQDGNDWLEISALPHSPVGITYPTPLTRLMCPEVKNPDHPSHPYSKSFLCLKKSREPMGVKRGEYGLVYSTQAGSLGREQAGYVQDAEWCTSSAEADTPLHYFARNFVTPLVPVRYWPACTQCVSKELHFPHNGVSQMYFSEVSVRTLVACASYETNLAIPCIVDKLRCQDPREARHPRRSKGVIQNRRPAKRRDCKQKRGYLLVGALLWIHNTPTNPTRRYLMRREHCTPVQSLALSGDGALDARDNLALIVPAFLGRRGFKNVAIVRFALKDKLKVCVEQRRNERVDGGGGGRSPRKPADQRHRPGTIPTSENPGVTRPRIEPGLPWWEGSSLTTQRSENGASCSIGYLALHKIQVAYPGLESRGSMLELLRDYLEMPNLTDQISKPLTHYDRVLFSSENGAASKLEWGKIDVLQKKTRRLATSSNTIPNCENLEVAWPGIEPGLPRWEVKSLTAQPPHGPYNIAVISIELENSRIHFGTSRNSKHHPVPIIDVARKSCGVVLEADSASAHTIYSTARSILRQGVRTDRERDRMEIASAERTVRPYPALIARLVIRGAPIRASSLMAFPAGQGWDRVAVFLISNCEFFANKPLCSASVHVYDPPREVYFIPVSSSRMHMERRRNEGAGETGDPRGNPSTKGTARHVSHLRKSGDLTGDWNLVEGERANRSATVPLPPPLRERISVDPQQKKQQIIKSGANCVYSTTRLQESFGKLMAGRVAGRCEGFWGSLAFKPGTCLEEGTKKLMLKCYCSVSISKPPLAEFEHVQNMFTSPRVTKLNKPEVNFKSVEVLQRWVKTKTVYDSGYMIAAAASQRFVLNEQVSDRPVAAYLLQKTSRRDSPFYGVYC